MHSYLTKAELQEFSIGTQEVVVEKLMTALGSAFNFEQTTVFLSHSHKDAGLVRNAVAFLKSLSADVYVDWLDEEMPDETSPETAKLLKEKIKEHDKFIVLATENSKNSKWVPWELGYADEVKGMRRIAVLPVAESASSYSGTEFVEIYPFVRKRFNSDEWVVNCDDPVIFKELSDWLTS